MKCAPVDHIIIKRLEELVNADLAVAEKIRNYLEKLLKKQTEDAEWPFAKTEQGANIRRDKTWEIHGVTFTSLQSLTTQIIPIIAQN